MINPLMSYVDVYTEAVVISVCKRRYKILLCKICFLARKSKQCDREPSPLGLSTDQNDAFLLQLVKSLPVLIPEA